MKEFLLKLYEGVEQEDIPKDFQPLINDLIKLKALKKSATVYKLDSKHKIGTIDISSSGTGFLNILGDKSAKDLLIEQKQLSNATKGDLVVARRLFSSKGRAKAKVVYILKRAYNTSIVYTQIQNHKIVGINLRTALIHTITASQKSLRQLPLNTVLKIENENGTILEVLGVLDDPKVDEKISLALFEKEEFFSKEAELEAKAHGNFVDKSLYPNRVDLTHLPFCTIDPPDAKDFDDAIYFDEKEYALYVAIADVSEYVQPMGYIDKEAKKRGFSIYFPHKSIPMLPRTLSENICSLKPNVDRLAYTFKITLDKNSLKPVKEELFEAVINSKRRFTYDEIDKFLENDFSEAKEIDREILTYLLPLFKITKNLKKERLKDSFEFRSSDIRMILDENHNLIATKIENETPAHSLIEDCMLLANKAASKIIDYGIFRTHEDPSFDKLNSMLDELSMIGIDVDFSTDLPKMIQEVQKKADALHVREEVDKLIIRSQKKAKYEAVNKGHFGLGFDSYTHFTSPIRRYSDLMLHRLLKAKLQNNKKRFNFLLEGIENSCEQISDLERESDKVAWDFMDRKFARWAKEHLMEDFEVIVTISDRNTIAKLDDELKGARIFIIDKELPLFKRVLVTLIESDIASGKIYARFVKETDV